MAGQLLRFNYADGRTEDLLLKTNPRIMMQVEEKYGTKAGSIAGTMYAAWLKLGRPGDNFDVWVDSVDDVEMDADPVDADPTRPAAPAGS